LSHSDNPVFNGSNSCISERKEKTGAILYIKAD